MIVRQQSRMARPRGHTLLELVGATTVIALALVPALRLMRDSIRAVSNLERSNLLATFCASKLEEQLQRTAANWVPATITGDFSAEGYPDLKFSVVRSEALADGGIPGDLMSISVTAWEDRLANDTWDAGELQVNFASKLARIVAYEMEANGT
jgi:hypothetical protein